MSLIRTVVKIVLAVSLIFLLVQSGIVGNVIDSIFEDGVGNVNQGSTAKPAKNTDGYYIRSYSWTYGGDDWSYSVSIPKIICFFLCLHILTFYFYFLLFFNFSCFALKTANLSPLSNDSFCALSALSAEIDKSSTSRPFSVRARRF